MVELCSLGINKYKNIKSIRVQMYKNIRSIKSIRSIRVQTYKNIRNIKSIKSIRNINVIINNMWYNCKTF